MLILYILLLQIYCYIFEIFFSFFNKPYLIGPQSKMRLWFHTTIPVGRGALGMEDGRELACIRSQGRSRERPFHFVAHQIMLAASSGFFKAPETDKNRKKPPRMALRFFCYFLCPGPVLEPSPGLEVQFPVKDL